MNANIVSAVSRFLSPELVGKLATASGLDNALAQRAVAAVVPSILSGLADVATKPSGPRQLANAVAQQPTDILGSLASSPTESAQTAEKGRSLLSSLLSDGTLNKLTSTVSTFVGIGEGPMGTLMGLLTPVIMSVLGREQRATGLDANGLARMLSGQKDEIADALPAGLGALLEKSGLFEALDVSSTPERHTYDTPRVLHAPPRAASVQRVVSDTQQSVQGVSWAYWVLPLLALAGLLWYLLPSGPQPVGPAPSSQATTQSRRPLPSTERSAIFLTRASNDWVSIGGAPNDYVNHDVFNRAGEKLGMIKDILVGPDGKMVAAVLSVGRDLGIGEKDIAVSFSALEVQQRDNSRRVVINAVKEALQMAPVFERR